MRRSNLNLRVGPLHSTAFRTGIVQAGITVAVVFLLAFVLWWITSARLNEQLSSLVEEDTRVLTGVIQNGGTQAALKAIDGRVGAELDENEILLLADRTFGRLAGNLPAWPIDAPSASDWGIVTISRGGQFSQARVLHTVFPSGEHLLAGQDLFARNALRREFETGVLGAALMVVTAGVIGAIAIRRGFVTRVEQIDATTRSIVLGHLSERLPVKDERDELDLLSSTINRMLEQIEQLVGGVRNVSNAIAHDLRTPLAELRARLETLLLDNQAADHVAEEVQGAIDDIDRLITTFNALLRLAELDSGARRSGFVVSDVSAVVDQAVDLYLPVAEARGTFLSSRCDDRLELDGDPVLLGQAVANLIDNALKYAPTGTVIHVRGRRTTANAIALTVGDQGPGIPLAERSRATQRFFRGASAVGTQGIGLGLSMVAAIARLHGGELELEDNHPGLRATLILSAKALTRAENRIS